MATKMHETDVSFLRRVFPLFPTTFVVSLAVFGHLMASACLNGLFASSPIWFWINYQVVFYPFSVLWPGSPSGPRWNNDFPFNQGSFALLALVLSMFISVVEVGVAHVSQSKSVGWAAGYSLHILTLLLLVLFHRHERRKEMEEMGSDGGHHGAFLALVVTSISVVFSLLSSWDYDAVRNNFFQSVVIYALLPLQGLVLLCADRRRQVRFSHAYCVFYAVLGMRIPDFLAFGSVRLFATFGASQTKSSDAVRYLVSMGYLMFMALYMRFLRRVIESMSAPQMFPRFLFHAQFYCYSCYYVLVSTARRLDALFFFMILVMNVYYVLNNTGTLNDWMDKYVWSLCDLKAGGTDQQGLPAGGASPPASSSARSKASARMDRDEEALGGGAAAERNRLIDLVFKIKYADQDVLADSAALLAIPTLITVFASLAARDALRVADELASPDGNLEVVSIRVEHYDGAPLDLANLWMRFGIMFFARVISAYASKQVFSCRIRSSVMFRSYLDTDTKGSTPDIGESRITSGIGRRRARTLDAAEESEERLPLRESGSSGATAIEDLHQQAGEHFTDATLRRVLLGLPSELGVAASVMGGYDLSSSSSVDQLQSAVLTSEFPNVLPYFILVAVHSLYSLFQNPELPTRYAFCSTTSLQQ